MKFSVPWSLAPGILCQSPSVNLGTETPIQATCPRVSDPSAKIPEPPWIGPAMARELRSLIQNIPLQHAGLTSVSKASRIFEFFSVSARSRTRRIMEGQEPQARRSPSGNDDNHGFGLLPCAIKLSRITLAAAPPTRSLASSLNPCNI